MNFNDNDTLSYTEERTGSSSLSYDSSSSQSINAAPSDNSWSVAQFLTNTEQHFKSLGNFLIYGEISELKAYNHLYFKLKDSDVGSCVDCAMWQSVKNKLSFVPQNGDKVEVLVQLNIYSKTGQFKLIVSSMRKLGLGIILERLNQLKTKLAQEGVFEFHKRPIPNFVNTVGVITSSEGRAVGDIIKTIEGRNNGVKIIIYPSAVQGADAPASLIKALQLANEHNVCDVLIFGRGGGAFEDLLAFYDEGVVRAVAASNIPIISAVGHEADVAFTDYAADMRAATPTRAAEFVTKFTKADLYSITDKYLQRLYTSATRNLDYASMKFDGLYKRFVSAGPTAYIDKLAHSLSLMVSRLDHSIDKYCLDNERKIANCTQRISSFEPNSIVNAKCIYLNSLIERQNQAISSILESKQNQLNFENKISKLNFAIDSILKNKQMALHSLVHRVSNTDVEARFNAILQKVGNVTSHLSALNPMYILCQGYSLTLNQDSSLLSIDSIHQGDSIVSIVKDGTIESVVSKVTKENNLDPQKIQVKH